MRSDRFVCTVNNRKQKKESSMAAGVRAKWEAEQRISRSHVGRFKKKEEKKKSQGRWEL